jgi:hypothetical protein
MEKQCFKCKRTLPLSEFYRHPKMAGGTLNKCKRCACEDVRRNRRERLDHYRQYDRDRVGTEPRKRSFAARQVRFRAEHPTKDAAHAAVTRAIRSGRLVRKPCEACGCETVDAHHDDYSQPLAVRWLCRKHHLMQHGNYIPDHERVFCISDDDADECPDPF